MSRVRSRCGGRDGCLARASGVPRRQSDRGDEGNAEDERSRDGAPGDAGAEGAAPWGSRIGIGVGVRVGIGSQIGIVSLGILVGHRDRGSRLRPGKARRARRDRNPV